MDRGCIKSQKTDLFQINVIPADAGISSGKMRGFLNAPNGASASGMTPLRFVRNDTQQLTKIDF